ncbi:HU family DNA-binding protein [Pseudooctadecabacter jejudonensis]|uniref:DNA-binding protein HU n=1 Tax=Pseudooctadecabacter jejudonensis TaxID=1391910 RepID=A0A1Y5R9P7_9RHOB|nr:HU family DNA-binding protein [Pseudooctadecabacter jejudonensis]SLN11667.1 DNA-binding protein HU [Pseudooctadecabacter jejudonensis]
MAARSTKTTKTTKTAAKPKTATVKKTAAKPAKATAAKVSQTAQVHAPKATVVETVKPKVAKAPVKKPELIDRIVTETGLKKKDVKPVVEAMLAVMGRALSDGEDMNLQPLGKVMIKNTKELSNATVMNIKIRQPNSQDGGQDGTGKQPLAEAAE